MVAISLAVFNELRVRSVSFEPVICDGLSKGFPHTRREREKFSRLNFLGISFFPHARSLLLALYKLSIFI